MEKQFYAHSLKDKKPEEGWQPLDEHLVNVAELAKLFAGKIGLPSLGNLSGFLHDLGKYSDAFQSYIHSTEGQSNSDEDDSIDVKGLKGKIDHSTAGAQYIWETLREKVGAEWQLARQITALCVASHHSGLFDCLTPVGEDAFSARINKSKDLTHLDEINSKVNKIIKDSIKHCINSKTIEKELLRHLKLMCNLTPAIGSFNLGMIVRYLFSALIDADRLDSANSTTTAKQNWEALIVDFEEYIGKFKQHNRIDYMRAEISTHCLRFSSREKGLYLLTVPTGGGKTLASLRFALHHAQQHKMDRIIYVIPYTSIIDQNAAVVRSIFENEHTKGIIVLEHHSNLTPEKDTWQSKTLSENWDAPIVYTTAVQFMESVFASGTRGPRRMHQLANAVIIFDEIQTLPIRTTHIFNNAINFLVSQCGSTVLFCTATQPILNQVDKDKGAAQLSPKPEIMPDVSSLFRDLRRVEIVDVRKNGGWQDAEIAEQAIRELENGCSVLVIVNTKAMAQNIYKRCKKQLRHKVPVQIFHLSTSMCPAHRAVVFDALKICLDRSNPQPVICVSTQLIEAGVDIDFGCVIRCMAGLDSIAQAAGRCNRNGLQQSPGRVLVVNPIGENLPDDLRIAKEKAERVLHDFSKNPDVFNNELIGPKAMGLYYKYYFFERAGEMSYPVSSKQIGRDGDLLSLLSKNNLSNQAYKNAFKKVPPFPLRQSFRSAAEAFKAIDAPTEGIIVPYGKEGEKIISELCKAFDLKKQHDLIRHAQRYSVNVFPNILKKLLDNESVYEVQKGSGILCLGGQYYSDEFGVTLEIVEPMKFLNA